MKLLWLVNLPLPDAAKALQLAVADTGSWMSGLLRVLLKQPDVELFVYAPSSLVNKIERVSSKGVQHCVFPETLTNKSDFFAKTIEELQPDVVHIFGTEKAHSHDMALVAPKEKTILSLQGILSVYQDKYWVDLPLRYRLPNPLKLLMKKIYTAQVMYEEQQKFQKGAVLEAKTLQMLRHVIGRTDWDKATALRLNPKLHYHFCNEILRESFYTGTWDLDTCTRHRLFFSQASYPVKGLHLFLPSLAILAKKYPDVEVYLAGTAPVHSDKAIVRAGVRYFFEYQTYCEKLAKRLGVWERLHFLGPLSESEMKAQYISSHVFVSASTIENESNSISEAKMLGVPVVSSFVGGVTNRIHHGEDGFAYPLLESEMAAYYIAELFENDALCRSFSASSQESARRINNPEHNAQTLLEIYKSLS